MGGADWRDRILLDPAIHHGDPCIRGTRVPVSVIVGSIADGDTLADVLAAYPSLTDAPPSALPLRLSLGLISCP